ncbi:MAG: hypothetical protein AAB676_18765 [Verrucomicrobiota bacterium]
MKKTKSTTAKPSQKTIGTRIVDKYRRKMNSLTEAERRQLLEEGLAIIYRTPAETDDAHRR